MRILAGWVVVLAGLLLTAPAALAESRIALVIGNGAYQNAGALKNPPNDARRMTEALTKTGFTVMSYQDLDQNGMKRAVRDFAEKLEASGRDTVGLVFYAGHGIQVGGVNYFIPIDAQIEKESDVAIESISADDVMASLENARNRLNIIILDACRNNPVARSFRSASRGLARLDAPVGSMVAFSTAPGQVAADGDGDNSPYTSALVAALGEPSLKIEDVFKRVRQSVYQSSGGQQVPWESSSILGDFYFTGGPTAADPIPGVAVTPAPTVEPKAEPEPVVQPEPPKPSGMRIATGVCSDDSTDWTKYCVDSVLDASAAGDYGPWNLFDGQADTAWVEGEKDAGVGQILTVTFSSERDVTGLEITNGYNKSQRLFERNSRPKALRLHFSGGDQRDVTLADRMGAQTVPIDPPALALLVTVEILSVYPGSKYKDTAISELTFKASQ